jgi:cobaltochelatase CobS
MAKFTPTPLTPADVSGIDLGRRLQLNRKVDCSGPTVDYEDLVAIRQDLATNGYKGDVSTVFAPASTQSIPEGTFGIVTTRPGPSTNLRLTFVWRVKGSFGSTLYAAAIEFVPFGSYRTRSFGDLLRHRGTPRMAGEPLGAAPVATPVATAPAVTSAAPSPSLPTEPAMTPTTAPTASLGSLDAILTAIIDQRVGSRLEAVEATLREALANTATASTVTHHVRINDREPVAIGGRPHRRLRDVVARMRMQRPDGGRFNVFLTGDAGTGKSSIARDAARALGVSFRSVNCSGGMTEGRLVGTMVPNLSTGESVYREGPLVTAFRCGGVFLLDEVDAADENVLLALNTLADATVWHSPDGAEVERHPEFYLLAAGNTYGTGASRVYSGRNQLDGAFLNRWLTVAVDYDVELETSLVATAGLAETVQRARAAIRQRNLRRWLTTRDLLKADALVQQLGLSTAEALREVTEGWTAEDRSVAGLA